MIEPDEDTEWVPCDTCGGTGEIDDPEHWMHPNNTHDGEDETWCLDCYGDGGCFKRKVGPVSYPRAWGVFADGGWCKVANSKANARELEKMIDQEYSDVTVGYIVDVETVELIPLPEVERLIRETCEAWRERDSAMSVEIENELIDAVRKGGES